MSTLSDDIGYGEIIDRYLDAYNRKAEIESSPLEETDGGKDMAEILLDTMTGTVPIEKIYSYDKALKSVNQYVNVEAAALDVQLADLKVSILEIFNLRSGAMTLIPSRYKNQALEYVDSENFNVVPWP